MIPAPKLFTGTDKIIYKGRLEKDGMVMNGSMHVSIQLFDTFIGGIEFYATYWPQPLTDGKFTTGLSILPQSSVQNTNRFKLSLTRYLDRTDLILTTKAGDHPDGPWTDFPQSVNGGSFTLVNPRAEVVEIGSDGTRQVSVTDPLHKT